MLYGTAEFRKNFYIKLRQMTGIIFRAPGRIDATRVHARASAKRATGSGVRFRSKADMCSAKGHVRSTPESGHVWRNVRCPLCAKNGHSAGTYFTSSISPGFQDLSKRCRAQLSATMRSAEFNRLFA